MSRASLVWQAFDPQPCTTDARQLKVKDGFPIINCCPATRHRGSGSAWYARDAEEVSNPKHLAEAPGRRGGFPDPGPQLRAGSQQGGAVPERTCCALADGHSSQESSFISIF